MKKHVILLTSIIIILSFSLNQLLAGDATKPFNDLDSYNVLWDSPSKDASGSMPLGNGDIGINTWMQENGDLIIYISKTDSWGDNSRLLKVGKVRISFSPNILENPDTKFSQELKLKNGQIIISIMQGNKRLKCEIWVDANNPTINIDTASDFEFTATAKIELWRNDRYELPTIEVSDVYLDRSKPEQKHAATIVEPDTILKNQKNRIGWYHHNSKSVGPGLTMQIQGLSDYEMIDPILNRTFGAIVKTNNGTRVDDLTLVTAKTNSSNIAIHILTSHPSSPAQWQKAIEKQIAKTEKTSHNIRYKNHKKWWDQFWSRSWIYATETSTDSPALIQPGKHPVRIGISQNDSNKFIGTIARASLWYKALNEMEIANLHKNKKQLANIPNMLGCWKEVKSGTTLDKMEKIDTLPTLTLEAWINPSELPAGGMRIFDKITPGGSDGFLLDTYPGNGLRLITKAATVTCKDCLKPNIWHHVIATIDNDTGMKIYLDDKKVAEYKNTPMDNARVVTQGYTLQRFITACAGRGQFPIKFNGTIFTVPSPGAPGDGDYRRWGPGYWWQNTRLPYISMCTSGDFDMMRPLFDMYADSVFELCKYRTRHYFGHEGAYFPECIYFWGACFSETYGWTPAEERSDKLQTSGWHKWEWVAGPELVCLMLDYYEHTGDEKFLKEKTLPLAKEVMLFFDNYYKTENGKLVMHPSQAVETWWKCTNPQPEVAGLRAVTHRILELPEDLTDTNLRQYCREFRKRTPEIPTWEKDGVKLLAPAEKFEQKSNVENPELYAVYPFRQIAIGKPNIELGINALNNRWDRGNFGWRQDDIFMAYLGLTQQAKENLVGRAKNYDKNSRFPAFWGPNYDWVPDQDHGGILMKAFQSMLIQTDGKKIYLIPAWPDNWNANFKVHAPFNTTIEGKVVSGKITDLKVIPEIRKADIIMIAQ
ncbi:MAG: LamG domain-containing protein [Phycisphaerae bacterium]|nr:LamG domain-containing protein [Phycisphaerae bacterium]